MTYSEKYKRLTALLRLLSELAATLAAEETPTPVPKPPTVTPPPPAMPAGSVRQGLMSGRLEVFDGTTWQPAGFIPQGYELGEDGGYWRAIDWSPWRR